MQARHLILIITLALFAACGSVSFTAGSGDTDGTASDNDELGSDDSEIFLFASDYSSSGQLYIASLIDGETSLENSGVELLGTEAVIRLYDDLLYVLHAGGSFNSVSTDNVQIIDPENGFETIDQFSTGNGTNPQDIVVTDGKAFISLYNPENDDDNLATNGQPGDVIEMDLDTGDVTHRYSFYNYLADDDDKQANAFAMKLVGSTLYVLLQDLESNTFEATSAGLVGKINTVAHTVTGAIELSGRNPSNFAVSDDEDKLFVATTNDREYDTIYSGLDVVNLATEESELFVADSQLAGYIEKLRTHDGFVYGVVSKYNTSSFTFSSKVIKFSQDIDASTDINTFISYANDIREIFAQNGYLWVSYSAVSTSTDDADPVVRVFDVTTGDQVGDDLVPEVTGISAAGL